MKSNFYYAKIGGSFINYLNLFNKPFRLKNTKIEKDSILYNDREIEIIKEIHPEIIKYAEISTNAGRADR